MRFPGNVVTEEDTRAKGYGTPDRCFYCSGKPGGPHDEDCVCIQRPVKVRLALDLIVSRPRSWTKEDIEFHANEGIWCMNNIVGDIERYTGEGRCLCSIGTVEYLGDATLDEALSDGLQPDTDGEPVVESSDRTLDKVAMNIVNQLFDLAEVPVARRQQINDQCDSFVLRFLREVAGIVEHGRADATEATDPGDRSAGPQQEPGAKG